MDFKQIKDIIEKDGGKIIIVENDKPTMVVMSFDEYKGKAGQRNPAAVPPSPSEGHNEQKGNPFMPDMEGQEKEELTIDDLPL